MSFRPLLNACLLGAALLSGCASTPEPQKIPATLAATPGLSQAAQLIAQAGLGDTLGGDGPYTVFVPSDEALKAWPAKAREAVLADPAQLKALLSQHVVAGRLGAAQIKAGKLKTLQGGDLQVGLAGSFVTVDESLVIQADVPAANGVVHVIDRILVLPPAKK